MNYPIVEIEWIDAQSFECGLVFPDELPDEAAHAWITGYLVKTTTLHYFIAKERWETGKVKYIHIIPRRSIVGKLKVLRK